MLRVNLLRNLSAAAPVGTVISIGGSSSGSPEETQKQALLRLMVIFLGVGGVIFFEKMQLTSKHKALEDLSAQISSIQSEKAKFGDAGPIVERYTEERKKLDERIKVLEKLTRNRLREVKLLDAIQTILPAQAWLESMVMDAGKVTLTGFAPTEANVTEFYKALENNVLFSSVRIKSEVRDEPVVGSVQRFEFTFQAGKVE